MFFFAEHDITYLGVFMLERYLGKTEVRFSSIAPKNSCVVFFIARFFERFVQQTSQMMFARRPSEVRPDSGIFVRALCARDFFPFTARTFICRKRLYLNFTGPAHALPS